jgi:hypothetical protein
MKRFIPSIFVIALFVVSSTAQAKSLGTLISELDKKQKAYDATLKKIRDERTKSLSAAKDAESKRLDAILEQNNAKEAQDLLKKMKADHEAKEQKLEEENDLLEARSDVATKLHEIESVRLEIGQSILGASTLGLLITTIIGWRSKKLGDKKLEAEIEVLALQAREMRTKANSAALVTQPTGEQKVGI